MASSNYALFFDRYLPFADAFSKEKSYYFSVGFLSNYTHKCTGEIKPVSLMGIILSEI